MTEQQMLDEDEDRAVAKTATRYELARRVFLVILLTYMVVSSALAVLTVLEVRATQTEGSPLLLAIAAQQDDIEQGVDQSKQAAEQAAFVANFLRDCTAKGGACYAQTKKDHRTDDFVATVRVACAVGFADLADDQRIRLTQQCVAAYLADHDSQSGG